MVSINRVLGVSSIYAKLPADFVNGFETVEQKFFDTYVPINKDTIFHSGISLTSDSFLETLDRQNAFVLIKKYNIRRFSFDIGPCFSAFKVVDNRYVGIGDRLNIRKIYELCERKIDFLRKKLPFSCEIAVENLNYYDTGAYEDVCEPDFYNDVCGRFEIGLVLDIAHAQVCVHNRKVDLADYLGKLNVDIVREFHLSKIRVIEKGLAIDFHDEPDKTEFMILAEIVKRVRRRCDVVIEYWKDAKGLVSAYNKMEAFFAE